MDGAARIRAIEADLDTGRSAVVQLVSTGEALMERRIAEIPASEWDDLSVNLTPRETVIEFLAHAFSMAGGTGRSYHADLSCASTERRIYYLLEPGWRAD